MLELDDDKKDLVKPITDLMSEGKYEEARAALRAVDPLWRVAVLWTVAAQTGICL